MADISKGAGLEAGAGKNPGIQISEALMRQVAQLARLELTDEEAKLYTSQLGAILGYVDQLAKADVAGVEPMTHPLELATPLREDIVQPFPMDSEGKPKVLQSAPDVLHDGFKVPPVL
jgi:aspartyl-tRNA(Asn)/glutamyl-tRNA(Gln) amidotransferase subunit C